MENENINTCREVSVIDPYSVDSECKATLCCLLKKFQNAAHTHALRLGIGNEKIYSEKNLLWIISNLKIEMNFFPHLWDEIEIETYPLKPGLVRFERECKVWCNGGVCANISCEWIIIDADSFRPQRTKELTWPEMEFRTERLCGPYARLDTEFGKEDYMYSHTARYSDIDSNHHVNNVAYISFALDTFPVKELASKTIDSFEITFCAQGFEGDTFDVYRRQVDDKTYYVGAKVGDKVIFKSLLSFK